MATISGLFKSDFQAQGLFFWFFCLLTTSTEGRTFLPVSVCPLNYSKSYQQILMKFFEGTVQ